MDRLSGQRPLDVRQAFDERTQVVSRMEAAAQLVSQLRIEPIRAVLSLEPIQIIELTLARRVHPLARRHFAGHDILGVLAGGGGITPCCHQPAISDHGSLSFCASAGMEMREREAGVNPISDS